MIAQALVLLVALGGSVSTGQVDAECKPAVVTRGQTVRCVLHLPEDRGVALVETAAIAGGVARIEHVSATGGERGPSAWEGPAVVSTLVRFTVEHASRRRVIEASFTVLDRSWPRMTLPGEGVHCSQDDNRAALLDPPALARDPGHSERLPAQGSLSIATLSLPPPDWELVSEGPNTGWYYATAPPPLPPHLEVLLTSALDAGSRLMGLQYGDKSLPSRSAGFWPHCRKADVATLKQALLTSEGCGPRLPSSRAGRLENAFRNEIDVNRSLERLAVALPSAAPRLNPFTALALDTLADLSQKLLDQTTPDPIPLPCQLRYP